MIDEAAAMRAWLDAHDLADAELLHHLANQGSDGADRLTDTERRLLSGLLETRRTVVPGYRPAPADRPPTQDRPGSAAPLGLFNFGPPSPARRPAHPDREERER